TVSEDLIFPHIVLPQTVKAFTMWIDDPSNVGWVIPLDRITWPHSMEEITINGYTSNNTAGNIDIARSSIITQLHLPENLTMLYLEFVIILELPYSWPRGLRDIFFTTAETDSSVPDLALAKVWPDISSKVYYMPHSTVCFIAVKN